VRIGKHFHKLKFLNECEILMRLRYASKYCVNTACVCVSVCVCVCGCVCVCVCVCVHVGLYRSADAAIVVCDLTRADTFTHVQQWITDLFCKDVCRDIPVCVVGNKVDLQETRQVDKKEIEVCGGVGVCIFGVPFVCV